MKLVFFQFLILLSLHVKSQTWDEWFKQKKTQRKYLFEQIGGLQMYLLLSRQGYKIASEGLTAVNSIKSEEYHLHELFFEGLKTVNSALKNNDNIEDIESLYSSIRYLSNRFKEGIGNLSLSKSEMQYLKDILDRIQSESLNLFNWYRSLVTDGQAEMNDKERIERLVNVSKELKQRYAFLKHFTVEIKGLCANRIAENNEVRDLRNLNGIK